MILREWGTQLEIGPKSHRHSSQDFYAFETRRALRHGRRSTRLLPRDRRAGATGMELAGALAEISQETLRHDFRKINPTEARIILMEGAATRARAFPRICPQRRKKVTRLWWNRQGRYGDED